MAQRKKKKINLIDSSFFTARNGETPPLLHPIERGKQRRVNVTSRSIGTCHRFLSRFRIKPCPSSSNSSFQVSSSFLFLFFSPRFAFDSRRGGTRIEKWGEKRERKMSLYVRGMGEISWPKIRDVIFSFIGRFSASTIVLRTRIRIVKRGGADERGRGLDRGCTRTTRSGRMTTVKDEDIEPRGVRCCSLFRAGRGSHSFPSRFRSPETLFFLSLSLSFV